MRVLDHTIPFLFGAISLSRDAADPDGRRRHRCGARGGPGDARVLRLHDAGGVEALADTVYGGSPMTEEVPS